MPVYTFSSMSDSGDDISVSDTSMADAPDAVNVAESMETLPTTQDILDAALSPTRSVASNTSDSLNTSSTCMICTRPYGIIGIDENQNVMRGESRMMLGGCGHELGADCWEKWQQSLASNNLRPNCPHCRAQICTYCNNPLADEPHRPALLNHPDPQPQVLTPQSTEILRCRHILHHACMDHWRTEMKGRACPNTYCAKPITYTMCGHLIPAWLQNHWYTPSAEPERDVTLLYCYDCYVEKKHRDIIVLAKKESEWLAKKDPEVRAIDLTSKQLKRYSKAKTVIEMLATGREKMRRQRITGQAGW